jgi:hypothetical protein
MNRHLLSTGGSLRALAGIAVGLTGLSVVSCAKHGDEIDSSSPSSHASMSGAQDSGADDASDVESLNWDDDPAVVTYLPPGGEFETYPGGVTPHFIHDGPYPKDLVDAAQEDENRQAKLEGRQPFDIRAYLEELEKLRALYPLPQSTDHPAGEK